MGSALRTILAGHAEPDGPHSGPYRGCGTTCRSIWLGDDGAGYARTTRPGIHPPLFAAAIL